MYCPNLIKENNNIYCAENDSHNFVLSVQDCLFIGCLIATVYQHPLYRPKHLATIDDARE